MITVPDGVDQRLVVQYRRHIDSFGGAISAME
jgi:hypothetical protein